MFISQRRIDSQEFRKKTMNLTQSHEATKKNEERTENEIGKIIIDSAISLHQELGPGLLETVYEVLLAHELRSRGLSVERQVAIPIVYRGIQFDEGWNITLVRGKYPNFLLPLGEGAPKGRMRADSPLES